MLLDTVVITGGAVNTEAAGLNPAPATNNINPQLNNQGDL